MERADPGDAGTPGVPHGMGGSAKPSHCRQEPQGLGEPMALLPGWGSRGVAVEAPYPESCQDPPGGWKGTEPGTG